MVIIRALYRQRAESRFIFDQYLKPNHWEICHSSSGEPFSDARMKRVEDLHRQVSVQLLLLNIPDLSGDDLVRANNTLKQLLSRG